MLKKWTIFLFLVSAYSVLLAHNFTPHTHANLNSTHHHASDHHAADHHHGHEEDSDDSTPLEVFHHFAHAGDFGIVCTPAVANKNTLQQYNPLAVLSTYITESNGVYDRPPPLKTLHPPDGHVNVQSFDYFFLLTAPPAFNA